MRLPPELPEFTEEEDPVESARAYGGCGGESEPAGVAEVDGDDEACRPGRRGALGYG